MKDKFIDFLIKNDAFDKWIDNSNSRPDTVDEFLKNTHFSSYVSSSFEWDVTPEGYEYWGAMDSAWRNIVIKKEIEIKEQFADVKVGDRVWSINHGWAQVGAIGEVIGFRVEFDSDITEQSHKWYDHKGRGVHNPDVAPTLFWDEITITPPEKPKREVTHTIERWVNVYPSGTAGVYHDTKQQAKAYSERNGVIHNRIACVKLTGTYTTNE